MEKTYQAADHEKRIAQKWEKEGGFRPDNKGAPPFCVMMPPPNVTGSLHIGHALDQGLQDLLTRHARMKGFNTLWQPGTDHAGIATQMMVERKLQSEGKSRAEIGREAFLMECHEWKEKSQGNILGQLNRLGVSADWSRLRFTMDEGLSRAVIKAFVQLYEEGLIYKDKRLVNWDCNLKSAVSDLEAVSKDINGHLWHFRYPVEGEEGRFITVATTRPETMLGDTGIAVHPDDGRYKDLHGRHAILPLVGRKLKIVADEYSDPEKGTGAVKITPAHDFNDFEVGRRHELEAINILNEDGTLNDLVPEDYRGMERFEARKAIVSAMDELGLLAEVENHHHSVPHGDRSGTALEPFLTDQWYCNAEALAGPAIQAIEEGSVSFVPKQWENTYFEWMRNIQPWCISRQLWWGHQIPAWYGPDGTIFVAEDDVKARAKASTHYGKDLDLKRDEDVLDTWFSSGLWPFSTLGWPDDEEEAYKTFYPTSVLVTGFDIIFFWVARMMMQGIHFTKKPPFEKILIHGLVRDAKGKKMSKTTGNVVDPLDMIEKYGADALRLALMAACVQGRDARFDEKNVAQYRNFITKFWNAARFAQMNEAAYDPDFSPSSVDITLNAWLVGKTKKAMVEIDEALQAFKANEAVLALYHFIWDEFCDWYIELAKPALQGDDEKLKAETRQTMGWVIHQILHLMHPMAPFFTEVLWEDWGSSGLLAFSSWPNPEKLPAYDGAMEEISWLITAISAIRTARSEINIPAGAQLELQVFEAGENTKKKINANEEAMKRLARINSISFVSGSVPSQSLQVVVDEAVFVFPVASVINIDDEKARLKKEMKKLQTEIDKTTKKLTNKEFTAKAPPEIIETQEERLQEARSRMARLEQASANLT